MHIMTKTSGVFSCLASFVVAAASFAECNTAVPPSTPTTRFTAVGDMTAVKDSSTQLIWMRCSLGQTWDSQAKSCSDDLTMPSQYSFSEAFSSAMSASSRDGEDWRLPNKKELASIVEYRCSAPAINEEVFPSTEAAVYWSSTPRVYASNFMAFAVDFSTGAFVDAGIEEQLSVRLVRDAQ